MKKLLVTGSSGLVGSEVCTYFNDLGYRVYGIDNNLREEIFGEQGSTLWNTERLKSKLQNFIHHDIDIRDRELISSLIGIINPDVIIHTAAQPSHDRAADIPFLDFDVNAVGTLNLLEAVRKHNKDCVFIHMSTNKVYGDRPNTLPLIEMDKRFDYKYENYGDKPLYRIGIDENLSIDQSKHSIFGASKVAADIMVQEYGRYFGIRSCVLRGGCLTGPNHSGVELHGFLSYLIKCNLTGTKYNVYGYKGKQVRDNIHAYDIVRFMEEFIESPRVAEVYNLGGGYYNSCSILEAFEMVESITGKKQIYEYIDKNREGDHICYYSNLSKMREHYPNWNITIPINKIFEEIAEGWKSRLNIN